MDKLRAAETLKKPLEPEGPPWARIEAAIMSASRVIRRAYDQRLSELGLNQTAAMLLAYLNEYGPISQTRLAEVVGINRASAGQLIEGLDQRGYVERLADPTDKRVWLVRITTQGTEAAETVQNIDMALRDQLRAGVSRADRVQLARTLERLQRNAKESLR
jgi:MarR family transcriptional regulator for hemolysin